MMEDPIFGIAFETISITICSLRMQVMVHGAFTVDILMLMVDILMLAKKTLISIFICPTVRII